MTYLQFHFIWTLPPLILMLFLNWQNPVARSKKSLIGMALLCFLAFAYTTPWDSYLIRSGIWAYKAENILGTFYWIPYEEYFFFLIQTVIACLWTAWLISKKNIKETPHKISVSWEKLIPVAIVWSLIFSIVMIGGWPSQLNYLMLVSLWSFPILFLQLAFGVGILIKEWKTWLLATLSLTLYFWVADSFAILKNIWFFPEQTISGFELFNILPIEEALFFLATNLMVVQGYILFTRVQLEPYNVRRIS